ncbi:MAG TPA: S9 family peptidase [Thermomicrobiaceae bacterium]|nr:S9 family peptidase [Thermomicrobiaceae bacterium]
MRLSPEDEIVLRRVSGLALAPGGEAVVYAVDEADLARDSRSTRLWRWADGQAAPLTTGYGSQRFPLWSPDGENVAFVAGGPDGDSLMVVPAAGGRPRRVLGQEAGFVAGDVFSSRSGIAGFAWSPDSRSLAVQLRAGAATPGDLGVEGPRATGDPLVATEITERLRGGPAVKLAVINVETAALAALGTADHPLGSLAWAPDGSGVYAVERQAGEPGGPSHFRLLRLALGGQPVVVTEFDGADFKAVPSPDGRRFAVSGARDTGHAPRPFLAILAADGTIARELSPDDRTSYSDVAWLGNDALVAIADAGVRRRLVRFDLADGQEHALTTERWIERLAASPEGAMLAFAGSAPDDPGDVYRLPGRGGEPERLTTLNPHLSAFELGSGRAVRWRAGDGTEIEGIVILPPEHQEGQPLPLILDYHGGPASHVTLGWNGLRQILAAAGYAVFAPNFRGGTGYGAAFSEALRGDLGGVPFTDSLDGVDQLISEGIADPDRLYAYGHSWGGYMTNWTAGHSDRFRAIVSSGSISDLVSVFYTRYTSEVWFWRLRGTPLDNLEEYRRWSPLLYAGDVTTPVLFLNGAEDRTTPPTQGLEMFTALRQHDVPAEYVLYPREGHGITEPAHQLDRMRRILAWFARFPVPSA